MSLPSCKADRKTLATNKFVQFRNHLYILQLNVNFSFRLNHVELGHLLVALLDYVNHGCNATGVRQLRCSVMVSTFHQDPRR
jgi:hypothetical protein